MIEEILNSLAEALQQDGPVTVHCTKVSCTCILGVVYLGGGHTTPCMVCDGSGYVDLRLYLELTMAPGTELESVYRIRVSEGDLLEGLDPAGGRVEKFDLKDPDSVPRLVNWVKRVRRVWNLAATYYDASQGQETSPV